MGVIVLNVVVSWICVISIFIMCASCLKFIYTALFDQPSYQPVRQQNNVRTQSQTDYRMPKASGESYSGVSYAGRPSYENTQNTYSSYNTRNSYNTGTLAYASQNESRSYEEYRRTHKISR